MRLPADNHIGSRSNAYTALASEEASDLLRDGHESHEDVDVSVIDEEDYCSPTSAVQPGVQNIEALVTSWTATALLFQYALIWLTYFAEGIVAGTAGILAPYITSSFASHSFTPTVGIVSSVVGGVTNLSLAKVLDVFGRPQGFLFCIVLATSGLVMMTACSSIQAYAAAQVFQTVGNNGILYTMTVLVADSSSPRDRGLVQAIVSSPNLITVWLAGPISSRFLDGPGWRYAVGMCTILVPSVTLPLFTFMFRNHLKVKKDGLLPKSNDDNERTLWQSLLHYGHQFDAVGLVLLSAGVALCLLPLNLFTLQGWSMPVISGMIATGLILIATFGAWERYYAQITFIPFALLRDGTVLGSCILSATLFMSYWCWNSFFSSYLQVVNNMSVVNASYVVQVYTVFSVLCAIAVGTLIHYTGHFKSVCLYFGIPMSVLGSGLLMYFCKTESSVGYIIMCQILISIAAGTIMICDEVAILAAAAHQHAAVCLAVLGIFGNVGGAIGQTIASVIWHDVFPKKLAEYLPASELANLERIFADINTQLSYPVGSAARLAIQHAYGDAQMRMLAVGTAVWVGGLIGAMMWRDINVISMKVSREHA